MRIEPRIERVAPGEGGGDRQVRVARGWIVRAISDRAVRRYVSPRLTDFDAIFDVDFRLHIRSRGAGTVADAAVAFGTLASGPGADLEIAADVTRGVPHRISIWIKPGDDSQARWTCSCGTSQRGSSSPELARESGEAHRAGARDTSPRTADVAVEQDPGGAWSQREIRAVARFHATVRSDFYVSDFELVVDGRLGLWTRRFGSDAALRRDEDARGGVSLLILDPA